MAIRKCWGILVLDKHKINMGETYSDILNRKEFISHFYHNEDEARETAEVVAQGNPQVPVLLLESVEVITAKRPETITKLFSKEGELVPKA